MTVTLTPEARAFLDAVRAELADLPEDEVAELTEDVEQHLAEAAADGRLTDLGSPAAYAAELRAAAGLPPRAGAARTWAPVVAARRWYARLSGTRAYGEVRAFAPELRPGWWVLRGYLAVVALAFVTHHSLHQVVPVPHVSGNWLLGLLATVAAVVASVAWGRRRIGYGRRERWLAIGVNAAVVVAALLVLDDAGRSRTDYHYVPVAQPMGGLVGPYGQITDIYPYDAAGQPLVGVLLFDGNGHAIAPQVCDTWCPRLSFPLSQVGERVPVRPDSPYTLQTAPPVAASPTPAPSATPSPTPSPEPTAKATPKPSRSRR